MGSAVTSGHFIVIQSIVGSAHRGSPLVLHRRHFFAQIGGGLVTTLSTEMLLYFINPCELSRKEIKVADDTICELQGTSLMVLTILANHPQSRHLVVMLETNICVGMILLWVITHALHFRTSDLLGLETDQSHHQKYKRLIRSFHI